MAVATVALFVATALGIAALWNTFYPRVEWRFVILFIAIVASYQSTTLFTTRVDLPAGLAFRVYPWKATGAKADVANTGIILTQIAPWTRVARDAILAAEWPLWNRDSAAGSPLLANQQTAIFHPFTLLGFVLLDIGKAFTFTASIRIFTLLFFTFAFLRAMSLSAGASLFGAIAYAFSTFNIVWLLFPLGLATMMLPIALCGVQQSSFPLLTTGLGLSVLGGHPESAFWVWFATAAYAVFRRRHLVVVLLSFASAAALTAFWWMPTVALLPRIERTAVMRSRLTNPANHHLGIEWLEPLVAPNVLGTVQTSTYKPPEHRHPAVLDDYGEVASGYAGMITLAFAVAALMRTRAREAWFFAALMLFALLTIAEVPLWRDLIRAIPVAGITMQQRLRVFWALGAAVLAAFAIDESRPRDARIALFATWLAVAVVYAARNPRAPVAWMTFVVTTSIAMLAFIAPLRVEFVAALTFFELFAVTYRYNPSAPSRDVFPVTPAIAQLQSHRGLYRASVAGWGLLPDTPAYYGVEDIKSTDPLTNPVYKRLMLGFLHVVPSYDEIFTDVAEPFLDALNVRYLYAPPGTKIHDPRFVLRYSGNDGAIYENNRVLPRYFIPQRYKVNTFIGHAIASLKDIRDFRNEAVVDHVPARTAEAAPHLLAHRVEEWRPSASGEVRIVAYENNRSVLRAITTGWSLLCSSDTNWPGWRAYVSGERQPTVTVNGAFLGVFVPPGKNVVEFRYRPAEFDTGLRVSILTLLVLMAVGVRRWTSPRSFRRP